MHLGILSGLIVALAGSFWGGGSAHPAGATYQTNLNNTAALYSILAQTVTTPTVAAGITPPALATGSVQAATTVTATGTTTGTTASTSPTVPLSTPIPLPTTVPQANLQINPFDWNFLTGYPNEPGLLGKLGPFAIAYFVLLLATIGASFYFLRFRAPQWKTTNPVLFRAVNRFAVPALWIAGLGILFLIFRIIPLDLFNLRFWLYLDFLALLGLGGWIFYWWRTSYPKEMAKYLKTQKARQYMPGGSGKLASRSTPVAATKGGQQARTSGSAKPASPSSKPPQQSSKNRKRK